MAKSTTKAKGAEAVANDAVALPHPADLLPEIVNNPGHLIRRTYQIFISVFEAEAGVHNLTPVQWICIAMLYTHPGIDLTRLAGLAAKDKTTCGRTIDQLVKAGLVVITQTSVDRRQKQLFLTAAGLTKLSEVLPAVRRIQQRLLAPMTGEQQRAFMTSLKLFVSVLNDESRAPHRPLAKGRGRKRPAGSGTEVTD